MPKGRRRSFPFGRVSKLFDSVEEHPPTPCALHPEPRPRRRLGCQAIAVRTADLDERRFIHAVHGESANCAPNVACTFGGVSVGGLCDGLGSCAPQCHRKAVSRQYFPQLQRSPRLAGQGTQVQAGGPGGSEVSAPCPPTDISLLIEVGGQAAEIPLRYFAAWSLLVPAISANLRDATC